MNDNSISMGRNLEADPGFIASVQQEPAKAEQTQAESASQVPAEKPPVAETPAIVNNHSDVQLRFRVNQDTKEMTIYIVDKAAKKVIRTIPPDEVNRLNSGDLVQLLA